MNRPSFLQEWSGTWPSGMHTVVGVLNVRPEELSRTHGLVFRDNSDDLDGMSEAALRLSSGRAVLLVRRPEPSPGTEVWADSADNPERAMDELLEAMRLGGECVKWRLNAGPGV